MVGAIARAHPNFALVKYWGKRNDELSIPAMPSLSVTVGRMTTTTKVTEAHKDAFSLNTKIREDAKVERWLEAIRGQFDIPKISIESRTNFATSSGLASSASGFAAVTAAINEAFELSMTTDEMCRWARLGSASAARSIHGGFVAMVPQGNDCDVVQILDKDAWDVSVIIVKTTSEVKKVGSTAGMAASRATSPFYDVWLEESSHLFKRGLQAVRDRSFDELAKVTETSCRLMHAVMTSTEPPLLYWNPTTIACIEEVSELQKSLWKVFYTIDAGPHVKLVCRSEDALTISRLLAIEGIESKMVVSKIGGGVRATRLDSAGDGTV